MKVNLNDDVLKIEHKIKKTETYKISKGRKFISVTIFKKPQVVKGYTSYCSDGKHILLIDYDNVPLEIIKQDYDILQKKHKIPIGYLIKSSNKSYHVVCLGKYTPHQIFKMISKTHADVNFMSMPLRNKYRNWVLRLGTKIGKQRPKFISFIGKDINYNCEISTPHLKLMKSCFPNITNMLWTNKDKLKDYYLQEYEAT